MSSHKESADVSWLQPLAAGAGAEQDWSTCSVDLNGGKFQGFEETSIGLDGMTMTSNGSQPLAKQSIALDPMVLIVGKQTFMSME